MDNTYSYNYIQGVNFLKVKGSHSYRARIHGRVLKDQIRVGALPTLAEINDWMLRRAEGPVEIPMVRNFLIYLYNKVLMPKLEASVARSAPYYLEVMKALSEETGLHKNLIRNALFQADGIMVLSRLSVMKYLMTDMPITCLPCCSSSVAFNEYTDDGRMIVARNQDYPIVGPWEKHPLVFFNIPTEKDLIPYISITSSGVQTGGLTATNKEGLTLATHAHLGTEISTDGLPVFLLGEMIISKAKTIDEAIKIARNYTRNANWAYIISSHKENKVVVLECTPKEVFVREPSVGKMTHTNYFQSEALKNKEALISASVLEDLYGRRLRMDQYLDHNKGKLNPDLMMKMLGDHVDYFSGTERVFGNTVSVITSIKSVVFDPSKSRLYVGNRHESPVGLGNFLELDLEKMWDMDFSELGELPVHPGYQPQSPKLIQAVSEYREAYRCFHIENFHDDYMINTRNHLRKAVRTFPQDGHMQLQMALVYFKTKSPKKALFHFQKAREMGLTHHLEGVCKLFHARCLDLVGRRKEAKEIYKSTLEEINEPGLKEALQKGLSSKYKKKMLSHLMLDLQFPAPHHY